MLCGRIHLVTAITMALYYHRSHNAAGHRSRITSRPGWTGRTCMTRRSTGPMPSWPRTTAAWSTRPGHAGRRTNLGLHTAPLRVDAGCCVVVLVEKVAVGSDISGGLTRRVRERRGVV